MFTALPDVNYNPKRPTVSKAGFNSSRQKLGVAYGSHGRPTALEGAGGSATPHMPPQYAPRCCKILRRRTHLATLPPETAGGATLRRKGERPAQHSARVG
eukprot:gene7742-biopygen1530